VGLDYHYDQIHHTNIVKAHELIQYAKAKGRQLDMKERRAVGTSSIAFRRSAVANAFPCRE
jgi:hypothetical protein